MKIAYFDCFSGIAGDMALGALLDCGVPLEALKAGLSSLPVSDWDIQAEPVLQSGLHALSVTITHQGQSDADEAVHSHHHHDHHHDHDHHHEHEHHHHGRSMAEIREIITESTLSERVQQTSLAIFDRIARAEAYLHHSTPEDVHFHEIGGLDSLLDICGVAWCLEYLEIDEVHCSPLPSFHGWIDCAHGRIPLPAPATLEILKGVPLTATNIEGELVTPTGAGIVAALSQSFGAMPNLTPQKIGTGGGKKHFKDRPNIVRVVIGESLSTLSRNTSKLEGLEWSTLSVIECNIDDMNPELYDFVLQRLFEAGALDVWMQPIQMKKNRPGVLLSTLCTPDQRDELISILLRETTTLGVRVNKVERAAMPRSSGTVQTEFGEIRIKTARWTQSKIERTLPEWDDVARLAQEHNVAARVVYEAAMKSTL